MEFTDSNVEKLILLVQQNEYLYDRTLHSYREKIVKNNAWQKIAKELNSDGKTTYCLLFIVLNIIHVINWTMLHFLKFLLCFQAYSHVWIVI